MKVWHCDDGRPVPDLAQAEAETPHPRYGEVSARVHAVGVTRTELLWQSTTQTKTDENRRQAVLGHEFLDTIASGGDRKLSEEN
jgi:NADPH:quinone reductase-like Zn-dependent oxidoreductase